MPMNNPLLSFDDLLAQPSHHLLIQDALGNPTFVGSPMVPCEVTVAASAASLQRHGYVVPQPLAPRSFPRHLFIMTRGTRGDVQPFVALAKGLANAHGWLVTICTELYWRDFVLSEVAELRAGANALGLLQQDAEAWFRWTPAGSSGPTDVEIDAAIAARQAARKAKDFKESDRIRDDLKARGVILEDGPKGTTWRRG